ncbi:MAG: FtsW/RodA/SpoVE family cell cycle protein, partial [Candidatus Taylorbacteria bacterium]|nr:FtsW/RodA/SpoVE family cell cycle protein [Candidatus Taylorbacteria bacterium]
KIKTFKLGLLPYIVMMAILSVLLLAQSDTDTLLIICFTGLVMFIVAGLRIRHVISVFLLMAILIIGVVIVRPYALERVKTFFDHGSDTQGAGYQIDQSLIAIGSGQLTGRGFGQSIQKFGYLPQPTDDSIFAVAAEEFGFVGGIVLLTLYLLFAISALRIARRAEDTFGGSVAVGFSVLVITESFLNMGAMLGIIPLSGVPLLFVSHGGTALIITLAMAGIVANVSRTRKFT